MYLHFYQGRFCHLPNPFFVLQFYGKQNPRIDMWHVHDILEHLGLGHALGKVVPDIWVTLAIPPVWARSCKQACKDSYWQRTFLWQALKLWLLEQKSYWADLSVWTSPPSPLSGSSRCLRRLGETSKRDVLHLIVKEKLLKVAMHLTWILHCLFKIYSDVQLLAKEELTQWHAQIFLLV